MPLVELEMHLERFIGNTLKLTQIELLCLVSLCLKHVNFPTFTDLYFTFPASKLPSCSSSDGRSESCDREVASRRFSWKQSRQLPTTNYQLQDDALPPQFHGPHMAE